MHLPRPGSRRTAAVDGALPWLAALPWATWAALRLSGQERGYPLVPALAFTPHAAGAALLPLGLAVRARSWGAAALAAVAGGALAVAVLDRAGGGAPPAPAGVGLRLATVSLRLGLADACDVVALVRRHAVDVLAVQELTPAAEARLATAGLGALLPHAHVVRARPGSVPSASGGVWSRLPVRERGTVPGHFEQPTVRLEVPGGRDVEVTAVHTVPPLRPSWTRAWAADLDGLPAPEQEPLRVLAGDFNATLDHAALRAVLRRGYRDAACAVGRGLAATWRPLRLGRPRLPLDHVLVDPRIAVAAVDLVPVRGSDHRALVVDLVVPAG
ncbi:MAG TPA: endonuclease/exonuclease/phosphatase family protein [Geodermatophilus sp.]|nr:endonuclease/exonuclease/phosphatase family protein [Geodermatophilus sp.]